MASKKVTLTGEFTDDDIVAIYSTLRAIEIRRPAEHFTITISNPDATLNKAVEFVSDLMPNADVTVIPTKNLKPHDIESDIRSEFLDIIRRNRITMSTEDLVDRLCKTPAFVKFVNK